MNQWERVALTDICNPKQWPTISISKLQEKGFPVFGANGQIGFYKEYNHEKPTILVTCRGATCGTLNICAPFSYVTGNSMALDELEDEEIDLHFLFYLLSYRGLKDTISGSAQPQITRESLSNVTLLIPPLPEQRRIAALLDKADRLRRTRRYAAQLSNTLLHAVFVRMFGDPVINSKGWPMKTIGEVSDPSKGSIKCGPFGSQLLISELVDEGIPVYGIDNVQKNEFIWAKPKFITPSKFKELSSFSIHPGDVLISRTGTVGRACLAPNSIPQSIIGPNLLKVSLNYDQLLPSVLSCALNYCPSIIALIGSMSPGATVAVFNTNNLRDLRLAIPPLQLQEWFVQIKTRYDLLRAQQREAERQAEHLFQTLLHRAFSGEL